MTTLAPSLSLVLFLFETATKPPPHSSILSHHLHLLESSYTNFLSRYLHIFHSWRCQLFGQMLPFLFHPTSFPLPSGLQEYLRGFCIMSYIYCNRDTDKVSCLSLLRDWTPWAFCQFLFRLSRNRSLLRRYPPDFWNARVIPLDPVPFGFPRRFVRSDNSEWEETFFSSPFTKSMVKQAIDDFTQIICWWNSANIEYPHIGRFIFRDTFVSYIFFILFLLIFSKLFTI